jgi:hypothetical protein
MAPDGVFYLLEVAFMLGEGGQAVALWLRHYATS